MTEPKTRVAFVLGGGGVLGSCEVGMLRALLERDIRPDLVLGTSIGAINGAMVAADPSMSTITDMTALWQQIGGGSVFGESFLAQVRNLVRHRTYLYGSDALRDMLVDHFGDRRMESLAVPFSCVAAGIETSAERWFADGPIVPALLASSAVPGLFAPVEIDGVHYLDGGLVDSIPVARAIALGAQEVYVLQVGRIETPLVPPRRPWEVATVAFEIARRHRFATTMTGLSDEHRVHVLPTGAPVPTGVRQQLKFRDFSVVPRRIDAAYEATARYLDSAERR
ncbi:MAG: patatin-like phospholipase family protein [Cumulibacter sp.]